MNERLPILHTICLKIADLDFVDRLQILCTEFLGVAYGPWQVGTGIETLDDFNYDLATLDCLTFVEVVLALVKVKPTSNYAQFVNDFNNVLKHIHYANGVPSFLQSNHFTCIDWIENNKYLLEDMTRTLTKSFKMASTQINKTEWFKRHAVNGGATLPDRLIEKLGVVPSNLPYIETEELLNNYPKFINEFPQYSIVTIVRPNWDLTERIGTHLNISHLGFAIKDNGKQLQFFHSTSERKIVVQETLDVYMQRQQSSPTIRGINVLAISPGFENAR